MVRLTLSGLYLLRSSGQFSLGSVNSKIFFSTTSLRLKEKDSKQKEDILLCSTKNNVTTLTMNTPKKLNGWTQEMMLALKESFERLAKDPETKVAVLTGADPYYCAGVNLSSTLKPMHPKVLHGLIVKNNAQVFNNFIEFPKPLLIAANGPAIGACVTSATLCDGIVASEKATFTTPFARLGIPPEGCSSVHFERIMGKKNAERMLGKEGWIPTAKEAKEAGFVMEVVPHEQLMLRAQEIAEKWAKEGKVRNLVASGQVEEYKAVNLKESRDLADAFLAYPFLDAQYRFLKSKGKSQTAAMFWILKTTRPIWSKFL